MTLSTRVKEEDEEEVDVSARSALRILFLLLLLTALLVFVFYCRLVKVYYDYPWLKQLREKWIQYRRKIRQERKRKQDQRINASFRVKIPTCSNTRSCHGRDTFFFHPRMVTRHPVRFVHNQNEHLSLLVYNTVRSITRRFLNVIRLLRLRSRTTEIPNHVSSTSALHGKDDDEEEDVFSYISFIAMDCEMVGTGKGGTESLLARCSLVTLDDDRTHMKILYDVYVKPVKQVTDYRTQWSGITPEHFQNQKNVVTWEECRASVMQWLTSSSDGRVVVVIGHGIENDFEVLKITYPRILIRDTSLYPPFMTQVRSRRYRRKLSTLVKEHLGIEIQNSAHSTSDSIHLSSNFVFTSLEGLPSTLHAFQEETDSSRNINIGHCSVEDAAATLLLYQKVSKEWEKSFNFPLRRFSLYHQFTRTLPTQPNTDLCTGYGNNITLYIDGCNVPMGLRKRKVREQEEQNDSTYVPTTLNPNHTNGRMNKHSSALIATNDDHSSLLTNFQLVSCMNARSPSSSYSCFVDWIPLLRSLLANPSSKISRIIVMFDGSCFVKMKESDRPRTGQHVLFRKEKPTVKETNAQDPSSSRELVLEITDHKVQVDDILVNYCRNDREKGSNSIHEAGSSRSFHSCPITRKESTVQEVKDYFESIVHLEAIRELKKTGSYDISKNEWYATIRRSGIGGTKTNKKLFDRLHIRRPTEGALCLLPSLWSYPSSSSPRNESSSPSIMPLENYALNTINELEQVANCNRLLSCELRLCKELQSVVVTDDVLLADRIVREGGVILSYEQFAQSILM